MQNKCEEKKQNRKESVVQVFASACYTKSISLVAISLGSRRKSFLNNSNENNVGFGVSVFVACTW